MCVLCVCVCALPSFVCVGEPSRVVVVFVGCACFVCFAEFAVCLFVCLFVYHRGPTHCPAMEIRLCLLVRS